MGRGSPATCTSPVARGELAGAVSSVGTLSHRVREQDRDLGESELGLGFHGGWVFLYRPIHAVSHRIIIRRSYLSGAGASRPWAVLDWAARESGGVYLPHRATRVLVGCGTSVAIETVFFSGIFYRIRFQSFFAHFLSKFHIVFSTQIVPTIFFREFKSYRNISEKFKVNEFLIHNFCCK
jgi:hypothetical protein